MEQETIIIPSIITKINKSYSNKCCKCCESNVLSHVVNPEKIFLVQNISLLGIILERNQIETL